MMDERWTIILQRETSAIIKMVRNWRWIGGGESGWEDSEKALYPSHSWWYPIHDDIPFMMISLYPSHSWWYPLPIQFMMISFTHPIHGWYALPIQFMMTLYQPDSANIHESHTIAVCWLTSVLLSIQVAIHKLYYCLMI